MAIEKSGKSLTLSGNNVYKGLATHNGTLLKLHENSFTVGYGDLVPVNATTPVKFGYGVWYEATEQNNTVYAAAPAGVGDVPIFAGILVRQPHISSGYPAANDTINDWNKALIAKEGYIVYKAFGADANADGILDDGFDDVQVGYHMYINPANGAPTFAAANTGIETYTKAGTIVLMNPDDSSFTVKLNFV